MSVRKFEKKIDLSGKYRREFENYTETAEARPLWARESEFEFAHLLSSDEFQDPVRNKDLHIEHWTKLLLWTYGKETLEEMAHIVAGVRGRRS